MSTQTEPLNSAPIYESYTDTSGQVAVKILNDQNIPLVPNNVSQLEDLIMRLVESKIVCHVSTTGFYDAPFSYAASVHGGNQCKFHVNMFTCFRAEAVNALSKSVGAIIKQTMSRLIRKSFPAFPAFFSAGPIDRFYEQERKSGLARIQADLETEVTAVVSKQNGNPFLPTQIFWQSCSQIRAHEAKERIKKSMSELQFMIQKMENILRLCESVLAEPVIFMK